MMRKKSTTPLRDRRLAQSVFLSIRDTIMGLEKYPGNGIQMFVAMDAGKCSKQNLFGDIQTHSHGITGQLTLQ